MRRSYKYRLYPTPSQAAAMEEMIETHRRLYNAALAERKEAWDAERRSVGYWEQKARIKNLRLSDPRMAKVNSTSCGQTLRRLDNTFQRFFRRAMQGDKGGYPKFKGEKDFHIVQFPVPGDGWKLNGNRVYFQHIGKVRVRLHRPIQGEIRGAAFRRTPGQWFVIFTCEIPETTAQTSGKPPVGIDLGLQSFIVTSDGESIPAPRLYRNSQAHLRRLQRVLRRRRRGSEGRRDAVQRLLRHYTHVQNRRLDFLHKTSSSLIRRYGTVVHERLNVKALSRGPLAKSVQDAGWGLFLTMLSYKGADAGVKVVGVNPHNTTQMCSRCGGLPETPVTLKERTYLCVHCGHTESRDLNAARNILAKRDTSSRT